jgi:hypothetical protein
MVGQLSLFPLIDSSIYKSTSFSLASADVHTGVFLCFLHLIFSFPFSRHTTPPWRGSHSGVVRFRWNNNRVILVPSYSPYYKYRKQHSPTFQTQHFDREQQKMKLKKLNLPPIDQLNIVKCKLLNDRNYKTAIHATHTRTTCTQRSIISWFTICLLFCLFLFPFVCIENSHNDS